MRPVAGRLADAARALTPRAPSVPLMSTVTGAWQPVLDPEYLRHHAERPVLFGAAVERLAREGYDTFVEVGHGATLWGAVRSATKTYAPGESGGGVTMMSALPGRAADRTNDAPLPDERHGGRGDLLETVGRLWSLGMPLDRTALDAGTRRIPLPTYPFQRRRYWAGPPAPRPLLHRVLWEDDPLPGKEAKAAGSVRSVLLTGPDSASVGRLAAQLSAAGVRRYEAGDQGRPDAVVLVAGPAPVQDTGDALDRAHAAASAAFAEALARFDETHADRLLVADRGRARHGHRTGKATARPCRPRRAPRWRCRRRLGAPRPPPSTSARWTPRPSV